MKRQNRTIHPEYDHIPIRDHFKKSNKKWRINWQFIIVWMFIFIFCGVFWSGVYKFVKLIAKGMGWL